MAQPPVAQFNCPNCNAKYKVVRVDADPITPDGVITCRRCDAPLQGREGALVLKYFFVGPLGSKL